MAKRKSKYSLPEELQEGPRRRPQRVADVIQAEVAQLLLYGVKDPRAAGATLVGVRVTDDLRTARIFFTCGKDEAQEVGQGLASAKGYIRSHLARELKMRYVPDLIFEYDTSLDSQQKMEQVFQELKGEDESATSSDR